MVTERTPFVIMPYTSMKQLKHKLIKYNSLLIRENEGGKEMKGKEKKEVWSTSHL
jgi:hypothetical protein